MSVQSQFNPYADENDNSNRKFQLSKSVQGAASVMDNCNGIGGTANATGGIQRMRSFGNDRTNQMVTPNERFQYVGPVVQRHSPSVINLRKENFHSFNISNNMIIKNSASIAYTFNNGQQVNMPAGIGGQQQHFHDDQENQVMFRTYDLNDEYWLNFE